MKAFKDHLKSKFKLTFFDLLVEENQDDALLENIYKYLHNKSQRHHAAITAHGPTSGHYSPVTLMQIKSEFKAYSSDVQRIVLNRVNEYLAEASSDTYDRLEEIRDYFQDNIKSPSSNQPY